MNKKGLLKSCILLTLALLSIKPFVYGQDTSGTIGKVSIASPNAASLGKYGDIPVSYHTGIPNIGIPIYTIQSNALKLPISLSYHASGLKVQEQASWVGAGWSLNAGGAITRTVMGGPDDRGYNNSYVNAGHYSDYGFNSYLSTTPGSSVPDDDPSFARGVKDGEPDLFFFNFGGYSGKFYFNDDRSPMLVPEQDLKIETSYQWGPGFTGFIVTTPNGVKYYFGQTGNNNIAFNPIETTITSTIQNGINSAGSAASSWFLNKIVSPDKTDSVTLNYVAESYSYYTLALSPVDGNNYNPNDPSKSGINVVKNFINGARLVSINFPNGNITFTPSAVPRIDLTAGYNVNSTLYDGTNTNVAALGSITINNNNGLCKKDSLYYGNFYDSNPYGISSAVYGMYNIHSDQYRLRLDSIREMACDGSIMLPPHKFTYFPELVPRKLSYGVDHWGFSNGVTGNQGMIPSLTVTTFGTPTGYPGANRDAAWPAMRGGSLGQITYPTVGYTLLDFEPNDTYTSYVQNQTVSSFYESIGFDGGTAPYTGTLNANGNTYAVNQSNTSSYDATVVLRNSSNVVIQTISLPANSNVQTTLSLSAGTYSFTISWVATPTLPGGTGAIYSLSQTLQVTVSSNAMVGGLRIKTISNNDGITPNNIITSYAYTFGAVPGGQTSGVLYSRPTYIQVIRNDVRKWLGATYCSPNGCSSCDGTGGHSYFVSPSSIRPMSSSQGNHIGYNEIRVSQTGNGYTVYRYYGSNIWDNVVMDVCTRSLLQSSSCDPNIPNFPAAPLPFEYMRGELKYEGYFREDGKILKEKSYYPVYTTDPLITPGHITVDQPYLWSYTEYNLQSYSKIQDKLIETNYDASNANNITTANTTYYGSNYHHLPTRKISTNSTGDSLSTNTKYAFDFRIATCDAIPDSLTYYLNTVTNNNSWLSYNLNNCTPQVFGSTNNCRLSIIQQYRTKMSQARISLVNYRRRSYVDPGNLQSSCYVSNLNSADPLLKPVLILQNQYNNPEIEVSNWKNTNLQHASFTKYDTSQAPFGVVYPGKTQLVQLAALSPSFTNASISGSTINLDNRYLDESYYLFANGNPLQVTGHDGITNSYVWDYLNSEPVAKTTNSTVDQTAYTSFEADGKGNWVFAGSPSTDATAPTGGKTYNLTNGPISKSGLNSSNSYVASYWSKNGSYSVSGSTAIKQGKIINGWTFFEHAVSGVTSVTVSGSGCIDELRLYPQTAQMTTYTYTPLLGMTSQCDVDNRITYYQYDSLGRLMIIKDQDGNIIKTINYNYKNQVGN